MRRPANHSAAASPCRKSQLSRLACLPDSQIPRAGHAGAPALNSPPPPRSHLGAPIDLAAFRFPDEKENPRGRRAPHDILNRDPRLQNKSLLGDEADRALGYPTSYAGTFQQFVHSALGAPLAKAMVGMTAATRTASVNFLFIMFLLWPRYGASGGIGAGGNLGGKSCHWGTKCTIQKSLLRLVIACQCGDLIGDLQTWAQTLHQTPTRA